MIHRCSLPLCGPGGPTVMRLTGGVVLAALTLVIISMQTVINSLNVQHAEMRAKLRSLTAEMDKVKSATGTESLASDRPLSDDLESAAAAMFSGVSVTEQTPVFRNGRVEVEMSGAHPRNLGEIFTNIAAHGSATATTGCVTVDLSGGALTKDVSTTACNSQKCPPCFIATAGHATNKLSVTTCSNAKVGGSIAMSASSTAWENALMSYTFVNAHTANFIVSDGTTDHIVGPKQSSIAYCYTGGGNTLYFPSNYFNGGLNTGSGYSGTGATLSAAGALSIDSNLVVGGTVTVTGAATFNGATTLGDATADTVTIKGHVVGDGSANPNFDFSSSTGTFKTSTDVTTVGGAMAVTGAATFNGATTLGTATADTVKIGGHVEADSSLNPNFDFSGSTGTFLTSTGVSTVGGDMAVTGAATFNGATTLGTALADAVKIGGHVAADGSLNPNFDFSGSTGTFKLSTGGSTVSSAAVCKYDGSSCVTSR